MSKFSTRKQNKWDDEPLNKNKDSKRKPKPTKDTDGRAYFKWTEVKHICLPTLDRKMKSKTYKCEQVESIGLRSLMMFVLEDNDGLGFLEGQMSAEFKQYFRRRSKVKSVCAKIHYTFKRDLSSTNLCLSIGPRSIHVNINDGRQMFAYFELEFVCTSNAVYAKTCVMLKPNLPCRGTLPNFVQKNDDHKQTQEAVEEEKKEGQMSTDFRQDSIKSVCVKNRYTFERNPFCTNLPLSLGTMSNSMKTNDRSDLANFVQFSFVSLCTYEQEAPQTQLEILSKDDRRYFYSTPNFINGYKSLSEKDSLMACLDLEKITDSLMDCLDWEKILSTMFENVATKLSRVFIERIKNGVWIGTEDFEPEIGIFKHITIGYILYHWMFSKKSDSDNFTPVVNKGFRRCSITGKNAYKRRRK